MKIQISLSSTKSSVGKWEGGNTTLDAEQYHAISFDIWQVVYAYLEHTYEHINQALRKLSGKNNDLVSALDTAFSVTNFHKKLKKPTTLYRGIDDKKMRDKWEKMGKTLVGKTVVDKGFVSTTSKLNVAEHFAGKQLGSKGGNLIIELQAPAGTACLTGRGDEYEKVLNRNLKMVVVKVQRVYKDYRGDYGIETADMLVVTVKPA